GYKFPVAAIPVRSDGFRTDIEDAVVRRSHSGVRDSGVGDRAKMNRVYFAIADRRIVVIKGSSTVPIIIDHVDVSGAGCSNLSACPPAILVRVGQDRQNGAPGIPTRPML